MHFSQRALRFRFRYGSSCNFLLIPYRGGVFYILLEVIASKYALTSSHTRRTCVHAQVCARLIRIVYGNSLLHVVGAWPQQGGFFIYRNLSVCHGLLHVARTLFALNFEERRLRSYRLIQNVAPRRKIGNPRPGNTLTTNAVLASRTPGETV